MRAHAVHVRGAAGHRLPRRATRQDGAAGHLGQRALVVAQQHDDSGLETARELVGPFDLDPALAVALEQALADAALRGVHHEALAAPEVADDGVARDRPAAGRHAHRAALAAVDEHALRARRVGEPAQRGLASRAFEQYVRQRRGNPRDGLRKILNGARDAEEAANGAVSLTWREASGPAGDHFRWIVCQATAPGVNGRGVIAPGQRVRLSRSANPARKRSRLAW